MFSRESNASKVALATLVDQLKAWDFDMVDAQMTTQHLISLGGKEIPRRLFLKRLQAAISFPTRKGKWEAE